MENQITKPERKRTRRPAYTLEEIKQSRNVTPLVEWFNKAIAESGMLQTDIADAVGMRTTVFSAWKTGRQKLTIEAIVNLCRVLGCDKTYPIRLKLDELFGTEWRSSTELDKEFISENEMELIKVYREVGGDRKLTPEVATKLKKLLETLPS